MIPRSYPPLGSRPIAETASGRNLTTSSAQPVVSLLTEKNHPSGSTTTSKRSFDTSIPQKESMAIFLSHPCWCGLVPLQLFGYGRSDRSTKLIRGLTSEAAAGFRSRRGPSHDSTLVTPHNAPFSTYKAAGIHHTSRRRGGRAAARGERLARRETGGQARKLRRNGVNDRGAKCRMRHI